MAGSAFDLDQFAPDDVTFNLGGHEYRLDGNPDVDVVAEMLRIEESIREAETTEETVAAVQAGKQVVVELMLAVDVDQDVTTLRLNTQQVLTLFALVLHGSSVASVVAKAISMPTSDGGDPDRPVATPGDDHDEEHEDADAAPLALASSSSGRSSISGDTADGLPVTGAG